MNVLKLSEGGTQILDYELSNTNIAYYDLFFWYFVKIVFDPSRGKFNSTYEGLPPDNHLIEVIKLYSLHLESSGKYADLDLTNCDEVITNLRKGKYDHLWDSDFIDRKMQLARVVMFIAYL